MFHTPSPLVTDGRITVSPKWGRFKIREFRGDAALHSYAIGVSVAASCLIFGLAMAGVSAGSPLPLLALCVIGVVAETQTLRLTPTLEVTVSSMVYVFAAVLFGPLAAAIVVACGFLLVFRERGIEQRFLRRLTWTGSQVLIAASAGAVALGVEGNAPVRPVRLFVAVAAAFLTELVLDLLVGPLPATIRGRAKWSDQVRAILPIELSALPLHIPIIWVLSYLYLRISPWSAALFLLPVFAAQRLLILYNREKDASAALVTVNHRLAAANLSFASALVATLDARDRYTAGHSAAVAIYARDIAVRMGLGGETADRAHLAGLVHDIGKIGLPVGLLEKPGPLGVEERRHMELHSTIGEKILKKVDGYSDIAEAVRHHHERLDGSGYPDQLKGDEIPLIARIIAVADAYNAMTSDRPYRDAMPTHVARIRLAQAASTQFDTTVVAAFEALLAGAGEEYCRGAGPVFSLGTQEKRLPGLAQVAAAVG